MTQSMTGYGSAQGKIGSYHLSLEAKSVNHKFCETHLRAPAQYLVLEPQILALTKTYFQRGRIDVAIRDDSRLQHTVGIKLDLPRLKSYQQQLGQAARALGLEPPQSLEAYLQLPQVIMPEEEMAPEQLWLQLKPILEKALGALKKMRLKEGASVQKFFEAQLKLLREQKRLIAEILPENIAGHQAQLQERIKRLLSGGDCDPARLAQEVAFFVDRTDTSEELQRLDHHLQHFRNILKENEGIGRKLDFLLQEMNRETNTLSAKAQNAQISCHVVECKHILEKMREQVQNIE